MTRPKTLIQLLKMGTAKNIDIINHIQPAGRLKVGFAAHENPKMSKTKKTIYTDEDLMIVFEAIIQSKRLKWSEAIEKLMFNEIKRIARDLDEGELAAIVRGFIVARNSKDEKQGDGT